MLSLGSLKVSPARPVAFRPTLTGGLALSIEPILAGWEDKSRKNQIERFPTEVERFADSR
jgi:hypothetical protein